MVKLVVRYNDHSTQVFIGDNEGQARKRKKEYEAKHPTLLVIFTNYG